MYSYAANFLNKKFNIDAHYFLKGGFWLSLTQGIGIIFGIATSALFAHYLSETEYGIYRYILSLAVLFSVFSLTGLGQSILQTAAKKYYGFYQETVSINFIYNFGVLFSALIGAGYYFYKENFILASGCFLIALLQPVINSFQFTPTYLQGSGRFRETTILQGIKTAFVSIASLLALYLTQHVVILVGVYLTSNALANLASHLWYRPKKTAVIPPELYTKYLSYAKHTSIRNILGSVVYRLDSIVIFTYLGATELAIYTIANIIPEQIKGSIKNLATLLIPKYSQHENLNVFKRFIFKRSLQLLVVLSVLTALYILAAPIVYSLLFPKYESAVMLSQIVALSFPAMIAIIPTAALQAQLKERELYVFNIQTALLTLTLTLTLIFFYGLIGAIAAKILSRYGTTIFSYRNVYRNKK